MNSQVIKRRLIRLAEKSLGQMAEMFIQHQCSRAGMEIDNLTPEDLEKLAPLIMEAAILAIGRVRAEELENDIKNLASLAKEN